MSKSMEELKVELKQLQDQLKEKRLQMADKQLSDCIQDVNPLPKSSIRCRKVLRGHLAKIYAFDWDKDSQNIVSASQDGKLIVWNCITTLKVTAIPLKSSWVMSVAFSPSGNMVVCGGLDNLCTVYDMKGNEGKPRIKRVFAFHEGYIASLAFLDENKMISASGDSNCVLWDIEANKKLMVLSGHTSDVMKICAKPFDSNILASGSCDQTCRIWDVRKEYPCVQMFTNHTDDVNSLAFHPSSSVVASASDDGTCRLFDLTADNEICCMKFETNNQKVGCTGCTFSLSGRILFVAQDDYMVSVRDTLRGDTLGKLTEHNNRISCLSVAPDGSALCTASWDNYLRIYA